MNSQQQTCRSTHALWTEEPARRPRLPDPVRASAVRAGLIVSVALIMTMIAVLDALGESWIAFPAVLAAVASVIVATWAVLDVWVTQQVWHQRQGVVSTPSSTTPAHLERREQRRPEAARPRRIRHQPDLLSRA